MLKTLHSLQLQARLRLSVAAAIIMALTLFVTPPDAVGVEPSDTLSFLNDVQPILTRYGCNSGGCHGKLAGQNGFRLSLRGYAPEDDHASLVTGEQGRRINRLQPEQSLLLLKAVGRVPHGGGQLFTADSPAYALLRRWIEQGAATVHSDEPRLTAVTATPKTRTLSPGDRQQLLATATYSDGSQRDVTWLARFHSNDAAYAAVDSQGEIVAHRHGEVAVVVSFQGLVDTVVLTMPYPATIADETFAVRNNAIDDHVMAKLKALRIEPAQLCDDTTFLRRVMLDLIGCLPTEAEIRSFLADSAPDKRARLVDRLFERTEFVDYWSLQIADLLQNRKERDHDVRGAKGVRSMHAWIRQQVANNRPWDAFVRDVLTASGGSDTNPAVGYYVVTVGEKPAAESEVADSVAQAFLGSRIGCAKCHNHPLEKYTQDDYYHFIAFFSHLTLDRKSPSEGTTVLVSASRSLRELQRRLESEQKEFDKLVSDAAAAKASANIADAAKIDNGTVDAQKNEPNQADAEKQIAEQREAHTEQALKKEAEKQEAEKQIGERRARLEQLKLEIEKVRQEPPLVQQPRTGQQLAPQGLDRQPQEIAPASDPRARLADWITAPDNKAFAGAIVNRMWKHFFAVGLVESVDDLRETNPPSNQPLYDSLIAELTQAKFDLRHLMKQIVNSRTYQLASTTTQGNAQDARFYSHYYAKRLPAEVLLDAIVQATGVPENFPGYALGSRATQLPGPQIESYFLSTFGRSDRVTACACERSSDVTLSQLLHLQNSETLLEKFRDPSGNLPRWIGEEKSNDQLIETLFLATYCRLPDAIERQTVSLAFEQGDRAEVAADLLWSLLNAKEFAFNH